jgi:hypothetical protein
MTEFDSGGAAKNKADLHSKRTKQRKHITQDSIIHAGRSIQTVHLSYVAVEQLQNKQTHQFSAQLSYLLINVRSKR